MASRTCVLAPQRLARCISKSIGLIFRFRARPTPLHIADNGLAAFVDVDMFDGTPARMNRLNASSFVVFRLFHWLCG